MQDDTTFKNPSSEQDWVWISALSFTIGDLISSCLSFVIWKWALIQDLIQGSNEYAYAHIYTN